MFIVSHVGTSLYLSITRLSKFWTTTTTLPTSYSASHRTARKAPTVYDILLRSLKPLCTSSTSIATFYDRLSGTDPRASAARPYLGTALAGTRSQTTILAEDKYTESKRAYNLRSKKLFGLMRGHFNDSAIFEAIDTIAIGNSNLAWSILPNYGQPSRTGLTNIDYGSNWSSRLCLLDAGIDERTITKVIQPDQP
eukprot:6195530-Pleurochrysis_carterae.AAC.2